MDPEVLVGLSAAAMHMKQQEYMWSSGIEREEERWEIVAPSIYPPIGWVCS